ncbi:MAG: PAS domain S-box protein [Deltaproteobacteria bacterium]|nr:PAS domain S-box protein [Deltaproteobacteria bacterium]MBW2016302.1 PAS domain S-box protein [Deltaproteobacteria bacterium]MBW2129248.1 PAS domain S-box protein [Deltaproteobacteria bacterium]MBW2304359.1 PAS domain S-box protein [Deltaproteobacteria bacterium]
MSKRRFRIYRSLSFRLICLVGLVLLVSFSIWSYFSIESQEKRAIEILTLALAIFIATSGIIGFFIVRFVNRPIKELINGTNHIGRGEYGYRVDVRRDDEIGQLASAINRMGKQIGEKQEELNKQKEEYRNLFEHVPCYVTVQDREFRLLKYNKEFARRFDPSPGDYCYHAYKGRQERCGVCPLVGTFSDGRPRSSEEMGINKDGTRSFWMVRTVPIRDSGGRIVAVMEMCLDVTQMKFLENEVRKSEEKYRMIFNTMPNPIFVLDPESLEIIDCNNSIEAVYGFGKEEILGSSFMQFFEEGDRETCAGKIRNAEGLSKVRQIKKDGETIFVNMYVSHGEYGQRKALLVTANDITARLMAEQQLIQAGKMATLGEMATGVAHELNQPLSVIKTASSFLLRKVRRKEPIEDDILETMTSEIDSHVDRASKIINHMREFGRPAEVKRSEVQVNDTLLKALEIFNQQLRLREIEVVMDLDKDIPVIMADANRLEQVFINLFTNARDAIEEKWEGRSAPPGEKRIYLRTGMEDGQVVVEVRDTGIGIPESIRGRIFDPFFSTKKVGKGTGLGLSISYGIVRDYEGTIEVRSREGEGSAFILRFPYPGRR